MRQGRGGGKAGAKRGRGHGGEVQCVSATGDDVLLHYTISPIASCQDDTMLGAGGQAELYGSTELGSGRVEADDAIWMAWGWSQAAGERGPAQ